MPKNKGKGNVDRCDQNAIMVTLIVMYFENSMECVLQVEKIVVVERTKTSPKNVN